MLKKLRRSCEERRIPLISLATEKFLWKLLRKHKPKICVEIWGAVGYSSIYMGGIIHAWGGKISSFEISYPAYQEGLQNAKQAHCYNILSYPYDILHAPIQKLVQGPVDFIFIDGQKSQYGEYLEILEKICSPRTIIVIDDVIKYHNKLVSLYWYLEKKQIKCLDPEKTQAKTSVSKKDNNPQWTYKILQLEPDDGIMIIENI